MTCKSNLSGESWYFCSIFMPQWHALNRQCSSPCEVRIQSFTRLWNLGGSPFQFFAPSLVINTVFFFFTLQKCFFRCVYPAADLCQHRKLQPPWRGFWMVPGSKPAKNITGRWDSISASRREGGGVQALHYMHNIIYNHCSWEHIQILICSTIRSKPGL